MIRCEAIRPRLQAYVDGETTVIPTEVIAAHLAGCPDCASEADDLRAFSASVASAYRPPEVPGPLERRVAWARVSARLPVRGALAAAVVLVLIAGVAWCVGGGEEDSRAAVTAEELAEVIALRRAIAQGRLALDLSVEDPAVLSRQLSERMKLEVGFSAVAGSGLSLRGARWLGAEERRGALVIFEGQGRNVGLALRPSRNIRPVTRGRFHVSVVDGDRVVTWEHASVEYTLVADDSRGARQGCSTCHAPDSSLLVGRGI